MNLNEGLESKKLEQSNIKHIREKDTLTRQKFFPKILVKQPNNKPDSNDKSSLGGLKTSYFEKFHNIPKKASMKKLMEIVNS